MQRFLRSLFCTGIQPPCASPCWAGPFLQVGLKYFKELQQKIPCEEVARAEATVRDACFALAGAQRAQPACGG